MDPLDPLTEIIKSGQVLSPAIALERILWVIIGFFFLGAILKSILNSLNLHNSYANKSLFTGIKISKLKDKFSNKSSDS